MGKGASKVEVKRDQPSPKDPKVKCVLSGRLDEFGDFDAIWDCLIDVLTSEEHSFLDQLREGKIKESQVTHGVEGEIIVHRLINGRLFDAELSNELGLNRQLVLDNKELQRFTAGDWSLMERYSVDKAAGSIRIEKYATEPYRLLNTAHIVVHRDPLLMEYWLETPRPRFLHSLLLDGINRELDIMVVRCHMADTYMLAMFQEKRSRSPKGLIYKEEKSLSDPAWDAFVSVPLDEFFTYEQFWDELEFCVKRQPWHTGVTLTPLGPNKYKIVVAPTTDTDGRGHTYVTHPKRVEELTIDKAKGRTRCVKFDADGNAKNIDYHHVHRNPLRLEVWSELPQKRRVGKLIQASAQALLNAVLDRVEVVEETVNQVDKDFRDPAEAESAGEDEFHDAEEDAPVRRKHRK
mmetsp:Transcript_37206/g.84591  ORF Transcript_37206/g.84591 Transcript_37206/m.84591 type:complete len:405 (-) Transcript_37206:58-1272(-)